MTSISAALGKYSVTAVGLALPENLDFAEWVELGLALSRIDDAARHWWAGDWWRSDKHRYGARKQIVDNWGWISFQALQDLGFVAAKFAETSRRREVLSFEHHRIVAALPPTAADRLLDWAATPIAAGARRRSTADLREEMHRSGVIQRITNARPIERTPYAVKDTTAPLLPAAWYVGSPPVRLVPEHNRLAVVKAAITAFSAEERRLFQEWYETQPDFRPCLACPHRSPAGLSGDRTNAPGAKFLIR